MLKFGCVALLLSLVSLARPVIAWQNNRPVVSDPAAYAVYAVVVPTEWPVRVAKARRLVVSEASASGWPCLPSGGAVETTWRDVVESFTRENAERKRILADQNIGIPYVVVAEREIQSFFPRSSNLEASWRRFYETYPESGGVTSWSAVGFDAAKQRALVWTSHVCGALCAEGHYVFLEKRDGVWHQTTIPDTRSCVVVS